MHIKYLLDTNIFIQSHNISYHPSFCNGFWDWLIGGYHADMFYSIDKVFDEMIKPPTSLDELSQLLRSQSIPQNMFVKSLSDQKVAIEYKKLMNWAFSSPHFLSKAKTEFAKPDSADAHLIATAMAYDYVIVTEELSNPAAKARILIPDAAAHFGVNCITMPSLLRKHAHNNFTLK